MLTNKGHAQHNWEQCVRCNVIFHFEYGEIEKHLKPKNERIHGEIFCLKCIRKPYPNF